MEEIKFTNNPPGWKRLLQTIWRNGRDNYKQYGGTEEIITICRNGRDNYKQSAGMKDNHKNLAEWKR